MEMSEGFAERLFYHRNKKPLKDALLDASKLNYTVSGAARILKIAKCTVRRYSKKYNIEFRWGGVQSNG